MGRTTVPSEELQVLYPPAGTASFFHLVMLPGSRLQCVIRGDGTTHACKVIPLFFPDELRAEFGISGRCELRDLLAVIKRHGIERAKTFFLATTRGLTQLPCNFVLNTNHLLEFPGGIVNPGEDLLDGGVRELIEELQLSPHNVQAFAPLLESPVAPDAGTHAEWQSQGIAVCFGEPKPVNDCGDGIVPSECRMVDLSNAHDFLRAQQRAGVGLDISAFAMLDRLFVELLHS